MGLAVTASCMLLGVASLSPQPAAAVQESGPGSTTLYLPLIQRQYPPPPPGPRFHIPYLNVPDIFAPGGRYFEMTAFWFGQVTPTTNYADVRVGFTDTGLQVDVGVIDRVLWYDPSPTAAGLTDWDAVTLYLDTAGGTGISPTSNTFRLVAQAAPEWEPRTNFQSAQRGNGTAWVPATVPFTTNTAWRGDSFNNGVEDHGWHLEFTIPFASLGLPGRPANASLWRFAVDAHDADEAVGNLIPDQVWPPARHPDQPATWGTLVFGLPTFSPPPAVYEGTTTLRHGVGGVSVPDGAVGGHSTCGDGLNMWTQWGNQVYQSYDQFNIQNQRDVSDWPCFSKYYVTFPLDSLPANKVILTATLTLHQFGGSAATPDCPSPPNRSLIQSFTVAQDWNPASLSWNNAPLPQANSGRAWVDPIAGFPGWPGIPWDWDLTQAVTEAYADGQPLRLVLYSADLSCHSGKYFSTSEAGDWNVTARPALQVSWGTP